MDRRKKHIVPVIPADKTKEFLEEANKHVLTKEFLEECKKSYDMIERT